jgi:hypothetical protein
VRKATGEALAQRRAEAAERKRLTERWQRKVQALSAK